MGTTDRQSDDSLPLGQLKAFSLPTVADQVFAELHKSILSLNLPPRTKLSETDVAKTMGVSRQPVREAFKRLAKLGFLVVKPQSSTTVSLISGEAVLRARYIRTALERQTCRTAASKIDSDGLAALANLIEQQRGAIVEQDRHKFHSLDDHFHREICVRAGVHYVWDVIQESKGHMDRIRMLSLSTASQKLALEEHIDIFDAISNGDGDTAAAVLSNHLSRILQLIEDIKTENHQWFTEDAR